MKKRLCRWNCGRMTDRICRICLECCNERDRQIAAGEPYIPPDERLGHRFYERKQLNPAQQGALAKARAVRKGRISRPEAD